MTECTQCAFEFAAHFSRQVVARFDGGTMTTDGGGLLLRETDRRLNLLPRLAECFLDGRSPLLVEHTVEQLVSQRVYGLALGYEDLNDHEQLRQDPLLRVLAGKADVEDSPLAGKSTLNRLELSDGTPNRYKKITFWKDGIDELLVKVFMESHATAPEKIILDLDVTDFALHGGQEGRFFHGYYDCYCYLPLYIFCDRHLLAAKLRRSNIDAGAEAGAEVVVNGAARPVLVPSRQSSNRSAPNSPDLPVASQSGSAGPCWPGREPRSSLRSSSVPT